MRRDWLTLKWKFVQLRDTEMAFTEKMTKNFETGAYVSTCFTKCPCLAGI